MGRQPPRASGVRALKAIKETSRAVKPGGAGKKSDNAPSNSIPGKRVSLPHSNMPKPKRKALGDVSNQTLKPSNKQQPMKEKPSLVAPPRPFGTSHPPVPPLPRTTRKVSSCSSMEVDTQENMMAVDETPVTAVRNCLKAATLSDESMSSPESIREEEGEGPLQDTRGEWKDIDKLEAHDPLFSSQYAPEIYDYMRERELHFLMPAYMTSQPDITPSMRTILVDWLIEVQENFELFHETLYLSVQLTDRYLSRKDVKREYLQLVGATSMLIAAKFEELSPPLVDDFLYLCDDAYTHEDLLKMERDILCTLDYDINIPVAYRFLRRLARAAEATMETHTLARYISESTLQNYSFVTEKPSYIAAASLYLALRIKKCGYWNPTLVHYSGYSVDEMLPLVERLNSLLLTPLGQTATVRSKYSHEVFFKVATHTPLEDVKQDAVLEDLTTPL